MHEIGIANAIVDALRTSASERPGSRICKVGVRLGELAGVDGDALGFCFEALVAGTPLVGTVLHIEACPRRHRCPSCAAEFVVVDYMTACPTCGRLDTACIGGDELEFAYIELEET